MEYLGIIETSIKNINQRYVQIIKIKCMSGTLISNNSHLCNYLHISLIVGHFAYLFHISLIEESLWVLVEHLGFGITVVDQ